MSLNLRRLGGVVQRFWEAGVADRQILVRSSGKVSYVHLRRYHQIAAAGGLVFLIVWAVGASLASGILSARLQARSSEIDALALDYADVIVDVGQHTAALRPQAAAPDVLAEDSGLPSELDALRAELALSERSHLATQRTRDALVARLSRLESSLRSAAEREAALEVELSRLRDELSWVSAVRDTLMRERRDLFAQAGRLAQIAQEVREINDAFGDQAAAVAGAPEDVRGNADATPREHAEMTRALLHRDVAVATVQMDNIQLRAMLGATQRGAANALGERDRAVDARDAALTRAVDLEQELAEAHDETAALRGALEAARDGIWDALVERDRAMDDRGQALAQFSRLERDHRVFRESQTQFLTQLRESSAEQAGVVEAGLAMTGLDVDTLIEALRKAADEAGRGGPMLPIVPAHLTDDEVWGEAAHLIETLGRAADLNVLTYRLPIAVPLRGEYRRSSGFGYRRDPFTGRAARHDGVDLSVPRGTDVLATAPGTVVFIGRRGAYGEMVEIDHGFGLSTRYAHLQTILVEQGQTIRQGDVVGLSGNTGRSTGPHLHYEVRFDDRPMNPLNFITAGEHVLEVAR